MQHINKPVQASFLFLCSFTACIFLASCSGNGKKFRPEETQSADAGKTTGVFVLEKNLFDATLEVPGELLPFQQVDLYAKQSSFVKKMWVDVGAEVKTGALLVSLEAPEISSRLAEASSRIKAQEAVLYASKASYNRLFETSKTPGTISGNDLEQALAKKNADSAQLLAARSAYREVAEEKSYLEIHAPFSGVISVRNVSAGAYVGPGSQNSSQPLLVLQQQRKLRLVVSAPALYAGELHAGEEVEFNSKSFPGRKFHARISRLAGSIDSRLRSERIEMDVTNEEKKLLPGMPVEVVLPMKSADSAFIIPSSSLVTSTDGTFVIRLKASKYDRLPVSQGQQSANKISVSGKLAAGDTLVLTARDEMRSGLPAGRTKLVKAP